MNMSIYRQITKYLPVTLLAIVCPALALASNNDANIQKLLVALKEQTHVPAFSMAIAQHGQIMNSVTVGETDIRNNIKAGPDTLFRLASVSKVIGATMLAKLVQDKNLDPNAPIGTYLPNLEENFKSLTTSELLAHISGIPHYQVKDANIATTHYHKAIDAINSVGQRNLLSIPGEKYHYSSHGYTLLSGLYEAISGIPLTEAVKDFSHKFSNTATPILENVTKRNKLRSNAYEVTKSNIDLLKLRDQSYSPFGTGMIASANDLALFGNAVLHSPMLNSVTRKMMFTPVTKGSYLYQVGFGWRISKDNRGRTVYHHAGVTPGARSVLILYPEQGLSLAFLSNSRWTAQIERTGFALADIILEKQQSKDVNQLRFSGTFENKLLNGSISCPKNNHPCEMIGKIKPLKNWLNQFGPSNSTLESSIPLFAFHGVNGYSLKLITSVGIIDIIQSNNCESEICLTAPVGKARMLNLMKIGDET